MPELKDIAYCSGFAVGQGNLLDVYVPEASRVGEVEDDDAAGPRKGPWPLVIWSQGSGWLADNGRSTAGLVAAHLVPRGFAVAGVSVRSSAQARFPAQLDDVTAAIRHLHAHAERYGLDPERFAIMGDSSGGWLAAMAALTVGAPGVTGHVRAAVSFYPPTDLLRMDEQMPPGALEEFTVFPGGPYGHNDPASPESRLLGGPLQERPELAKQASPVTHVHQEAPPFLILHGQADRIVPYGQGRALYSALAEAGRDVTMISLPHAGHGPWNDFLTDPRTKQDAFSVSSRGGRATGDRAADPTWDTVGEFLRRNLDGPRLNT
ncbi:alpha/beta hydrolase [Streptomyces sp. NPDC002896]|uniref:alpha/beta hydrolase n=1 Tax=Streptomyces sp. NPDC002896 TaxID=3154438 RepID=UPI0033244049